MQQDVLTTNLEDSYIESDRISSLISYHKLYIIHYGVRWSSGRVLATSRFESDHRHYVATLGKLFTL